MVTVLRLIKTTTAAVKNLWVLYSGIENKLPKIGDYVTYSFMKKLPIITRNS